MSFKKFTAAESAVNKGTLVEPSTVTTVVGSAEKLVEPADKISGTAISTDKS
ncbi:cytoplasmic tRNA 2-thiolation protein 2 [Alphaproteobacteria bacterium]|jgi:hypothetical protein|nr:cytoplasmic tRNA 2-thiolation protein 2 [Alphaproteobacteria bacterium]